MLGDIASELCTGQKNEPQMGKRENEGKKEKKQKKERKEKRKQYRGLYLNPLSVPRARVCECASVHMRACEGVYVRVRARKRLAQRDSKVGDWVDLLP